MEAQVPFNDLHRYALTVAGPLGDVARRVIGSGWYLLGPETDRFESDFAAFCGAAGCVAVANGTDALELALRALEVTAGDEVVLAANAGGYATTGCLAIGAVPVYADVDADTLLLDPGRVAALVSPATRAVVVTHLYGNVADVDALRAVLPAGVAIVEDGAQAHGASRDERRVGSLADVATFSFYPTKNLGALGDAGAVVSDRTDVVRRTRALRQYGWESRYHATVPGGRNSRIDELQAAFLTVLLGDVLDRNARRGAIRQRYVEALSDRIAFVHGPDGSVSATHLCVIRHDDRDRFAADLAASGVGTAVHFPVADHRQPALRDRPIRHDDLAHTLRACDEVLSLPCFPELRDDEIEAVIRAVGAAA